MPNCRPPAACLMRHGTRSIPGCAQVTPFPLTRNDDSLGLRESQQWLRMAPSPWMWRREVRYKFTNISVEHIPSSFRFKCWANQSNNQAIRRKTESLMFRRNVLHTSSRSRNKTNSNKPAGRRNSPCYFLVTRLSYPKDRSAMFIRNVGWISVRLIPLKYWFI
jgi:hypothetical protein